MKKAQRLTLILLAFALVACSEGESTEMKPNDKVVFSTQVHYIKNGKKKADQGATLYIFENLNKTENYSYSKGQYTNNTTGKSINYTHKSTANNIGIATLETHYGQECIAVIQSAAYPTQYSESIHKLNRNQSQIGLGQVVFKEKEK